MQRVHAGLVKAMAAAAGAVALSSVGSEVVAATLGHQALRVRESAFDVYHPPSSAATLYADIVTYCTDLEGRIDSGKLSRPVQTYQEAPLPPLPEGVKLTKEQERARQLEPRDLEIVPREVLSEEETLLALYKQVVDLRSSLPYPGYMEVRHLDGAQARLSAAYGKLRLALGEPAYASLEADHGAWMMYYNRLLQREQYLQAIEYMRADEKLTPEKALEQAKAAIPVIPLPPMSLDRQYPEVEIPALIAGAGGAAIYGDASLRTGGAAEADSIDADEGTSVEAVDVEEAEPAPPEADPESALPAEDDVADEVEMTDEAATIEAAVADEAPEEMTDDMVTEPEVAADAEPMMADEEPVADEEPMVADEPMVVDEEPAMVEDQPAAQEVVADEPADDAALDDLSWPGEESAEPVSSDPVAAEPAPEPTEAETVPPTEEVTEEVVEEAAEEAESSDTGGSALDDLAWPE